MGAGMSEVLENQYKQLVHDVYIAPIRSVIVVDDDFPTLDRLLTAEAVLSSDVSQQTPAETAVQTTSAKSTASVLQEEPAPESYIRPVIQGPKRDVETVRKLVSLCRNREVPWLVDVHDGRDVNTKDELKIAPYLHHSDLMILDYHLMGDDNGGDRAIAIMRKLAANSHFNLVIVYTRGYKGDIRSVFEQIAVGLTCRGRTTVSLERKNALDELIKLWEDEDEDIAAKLLGLFDTAAYLAEMASPGATLSNKAIGPRIVELMRHCPDAVKERSKALLKGGKLAVPDVVDWLLVQRHEEKNKEMSAVDLGDVASSFSEDVNWIRTNSLFLTVVNKEREPAELVDTLLQALNAWGPVPHQLLMGMMRAQMDERGVLAAAEVLTDKFVQAGWLLEMFDGKGDRDRAVRHSVDRHWEALGDKMRAGIQPFAERLFENLHAQGRSAVFARFGQKNIKFDDNNVQAHLNHYYSTKPIDRAHLTTGHILEFNGGDNENDVEYWVCLSPACDLVPGQKTNGWNARLGHYLPFIAVALHKVSVSTALDRISENIFLFIKTGENVAAFTVYKDANVASAPAWEQMFASQQGRFVTGSQKLKIRRMFEQNDELNSGTSEVGVVGQLRYEYALNLQQRMTNSLSRIGLGFRKHDIQTGSGKSVAAPAGSEAVAAVPVVSGTTVTQLT